MDASRRHLLYYSDTRILLEPARRYLIGRSAEADIRLDEKTVSRRHLSLSFDGGWIAEDLSSTNGTQVNYAPVEKAILRDGDHISIGPFVCIYRSFDPAHEGEAEYDALLDETLILERKIRSLITLSPNEKVRDEIYNLKHFLNSILRRLNALASIDRLTGLYNRRYLDQQLTLELERALRYRHGLGLIMIDIDHFKQFNDRYGHQKGDEVLSAAGAILRENTRATDLAARYGGEELAVLLPEVTPGQAQLAAEKIRRQIEAESEARTGLKITASLGVAVSGQASRGPGALIAAADAALYRAKEKGRNRVEAAAREEQGSE